MSKISKHAYRRFSERTDYTPNQKNHEAKEALKCGKKISQFKEPFYTYLLHRQKPGERTSTLIYNEHLYVFDNYNHKLITVYPVPNQFVPTKNFLGQDKGRYIIKIGTDRNGLNLYVMDGEYPLEFKTKQKAHNYVLNCGDMGRDYIVILLE